MGPGGPSFLKGPDSAQLLPRHIGPREAGASLHLEGDKHHHPLPVEALMAAGAPRGAKKGMPFVGSLIFLEKKKTLAFTNQPVINLLLTICLIELVSD